MVLENIALSGGGVKGYSYIGVIRYLEEYGLRKGIKRISGTSAGAVITLMFVLGYTSQELENIASNLDLKKLENIDINLLFSGYGLDDCSKMEQMLNYFIKHKGVSKDVTFIQLYKLTGIHVYINACDIETQSEKVFDHILTPDVKVTYGCRCSMTIPFIWTVSDNRYIDGCFVKNLPIELLPMENTIGFYIEGLKNKSPVIDFRSYAARVIYCIFAKGNGMEIENYKLRGYRLIGIETFTNALNIHITKDLVKCQIETGYTACETHMNLKE